jgi:hypothetical protein
MVAKLYMMQMQIQVVVVVLAGIHLAVLAAQVL